MDKAILDWEDDGGSSARFVIQEWQEPGKVFRTIVEDPRYQAIKASQIAR